ncbi:ribbon-helix-helix protein, CopG family [candidate division WOR-3 bacterium]|uniref:Ribbon-helix-helix protein, CopG family n=1 Tax=candidate division WOR-3 bacterium TaxID=2052148 RepID=A0A937XG00_UNCW3|nr:ribbon-helix-helix protein, CopG family [candidate division WOR-3 bacterium]
MARRQKVTVTIASDRLEQLDEIAVARDTNRSALIEEALEVWEKEQLNQELAVGYKAMAEEDRRTAEERLRSGSENLD